MVFSFNLLLYENENQDASSNHQKGLLPKKSEEGPSRRI